MPHIDGVLFLDVICIQDPFVKEFMAVNKHAKYGLRWNEAELTESEKDMIDKNSIWLFGTQPTIVRTKRVFVDKVLSSIYLS